MIPVDDISDLYAKSNEATREAVSLLLENQDKAAITGVTKQGSDQVTVRASADAGDGMRILFGTILLYRQQYGESWYHQLRNTLR